MYPNFLYVAPSVVRPMRCDGDIQWTIAPPIVNSWDPHANDNLQLTASATPVMYIPLYVSKLFQQFSHLELTLCVCLCDLIDVPSFAFLTACMSLARDTCSTLSLTCVLNNLTPVFESKCGKTNKVRTFWLCWLHINAFLTEKLFIKNIFL